MSNLESLIKEYVPILCGHVAYEYVYVRYWRTNRIVHVEYNWHGWPVTIQFIDYRPIKIYTDKWRPYSADPLYVAGNRIVSAVGVYPFGRTDTTVYARSAPVLWWANDMTITVPDGCNDVYFGKTIMGRAPDFSSGRDQKDPKIDYHFEDYEYVFVIMIMIILAAFFGVYAHRGLRAARMQDLDKKITSLGL